jgi:hypothetical protein
MKCLLKTPSLKAVSDVSIGCRIMVVKNLLTERGFLNRHDGKYPWSSDVTDPRREPPCPSRDGLIPYIDGKILIPILHSNREFSCHNISCSRTQFSTTIAYAILFIRGHHLSMMCSISASATAILYLVSHTWSSLESSG